MGSSGSADDWLAIQLGTREVRASTKHFLESPDERELDRTVTYTGSLLALRKHGLHLRYALLRIAAHHYFHIGVVACQRDRQGDRVGDYPGLMTECL